MKRKVDEPINTNTRKHQETVKDWRFAEPARTMYEWYDLLNEGFFDSKVPTPLISFKQDHRNTCGYYVPGRNEIGARENINLPPEHLHRPLPELLLTLTHEMVHAWDEKWGRPGKGNYHSKSCRAKMDEIGIPCDSRGRSLGMHDPFFSFLKKHGVRANTKLEMPPLIIKRGSRSGTRLKRWKCDCTTLWALHEVAVRCIKCRKRFFRA